MAVNGQLIAPSPADELLGRLDEPRVADALNTLLDHADLLAVIVSGLDGFARRGDVIATTLSEAVGELRGGTAGMADIDYRGLAASLGTLAGSAPALTALVDRVSDPAFQQVATGLIDAVAEGREQLTRNPDVPTGVFGLLRALKDPDVARGLGFLVHVAKAFGQRL